MSFWVCANCGRRGSENEFHIKHDDTGLIACSYTCARALDEKERQKREAAWKRKLEAENQAIQAKQLAEKQVEATREAAKKQAEATREAARIAAHAQYEAARRHEEAAKIEAAAQEKVAEAKNRQADEIKKTREAEELRRKQDENYSELLLKCGVIVKENNEDGSVTKNRMAQDGCKEFMLHGCTLDFDGVNEFDRKNAHPKLTVSLFHNNTPKGTGKMYFTVFYEKENKEPPVKQGESAETGRKTWTWKYEKLGGNFVYLSEPFSLEAGEDIEGKTFELVSGEKFQFGWKVRAYIAAVEYVDGKYQPVAFYDPKCTRNLQNYDEKTDSVIVPAGIKGIEYDAYKGNSKLKRVVIEEGAEYIGSSAFEDCTALQDITLPVSVIKINKSAFAGCSSLKKIKVPENLTTLKDSAFINSGLEEVSIPESLTEIGAYAFQKCTYLKKISLPDTLKVINEYAFSKTAISEINLPSELKEISECLFWECKRLKNIAIPENVLKIGSSAFSDCSTLDSISLPENLSEIGYCAFENCEALKSVQLPKSLKSIGEKAFYNTSLTEITVPSGVKKLGKDDAYYKIEGGNIWGDGGITVLNEKATEESGIFAFCKSLKSAVLEEGIVNAGGGLFANCTALETVTLPSTLKKLGWGVFKNCKALQKIIFGGTAQQWWNIEKNKLWVDDNVCMTVECSDKTICDKPFSADENGKLLIRRKDNYYKVKDVVIPDGVKEIGKELFSDSYMKSIKLPESLKSIGDDAFKYCCHLESIEIPDGVTSIGENAFENSSIKYIKLPKGIKKLNEGLFKDCKKLIDIDYPGTREEFQLIVKKSSYNWNAGQSYDCLIHCKDGDLDRNCQNVIKDRSITTLTIQDGRRIIGFEAYFRFEKLKSVILPNSIKEIRQGAFFGCNSLISIEYKGTIEQWKSISKGKNWNNNVPVKNVKCSDGETSISEPKKVEKVSTKIEETKEQIPVTEPVSPAKTEKTEPATKADSSEKTKKTAKAEKPTKSEKPSKTKKTEKPAKVTKVVIEDDEEEVDDDEEFFKLK